MELWELQIQKRGPGFSDLDQGQLQIIYYLVSFSSSEVKVQDKREYGSSALLLWPVLWDVAAFPALCQPFPQVWIGGWASKTVRTDRRGTSTNAMVQCFSLCCRTGDRENIPTERERESGQRKACWENIQIPFISVPIVLLNVGEKNTFRFWWRL